MDARFVGWRRSVLVARPRQHALGLLVADVLVNLYVARASGARLLLLGDAGDTSLLRLRCREVPWVDPRGLRGRVLGAAFGFLLLAGQVAFVVRNLRNSLIAVAAVVSRAVIRPLAWLASMVVIVRNFLAAVSNALVQQVRRLGIVLVDVVGRPKTGSKRRKAWVDRQRARVKVLDGWILPRRSTLGGLRDRVAAVDGRAQAWLDAHRLPSRPGRDVHHGFDIRRLACTEPLRVQLAPEDEAAAAQLAADLGLSPATPIVVLHVREGTTKAAEGIDDRSRDTARNAVIDAFFPAIDEIMARGCTVVRVGDPSMTPINRPGVVDLATGPRRTQALELWCLARCRFFVACDSGPYLLSWLFDVPCLSVNITNILGVFPLRSRDRYLVKRVRETGTGRIVPLDDMLQQAFVYALRRRLYKTRDLEYVDNTPEELLAAVREMFASVEGTAGNETPAQAAYRVSIDAVRNGELSRAKTWEKTGSAEVFLGMGRVVDAFAAARLDA